MNTEPRDESGTVAIMVALLSLVLLSSAALAVDLGSTFVRKHEVQQWADMAALAGGAGNNLPAPGPFGTCPYGARATATDPAVTDAAQSLSDQPGPPVTASQLVDCLLENGEALYGTLARVGGEPTLSPNRNQLTVIAPVSRVQMGFARVLGNDHIDVPGQATAEVRSPQISSVPFYAFTGCDFGGQTLSQPNNDHATNGVLLSHPDETNTAVLQGPLTDPSGNALDSIALNETVSVRISGTGLGTVTEVGFFESGISSAGPEPVVVPSASFEQQTSTAITVEVPSGVSSVQDVWYLRVKVGDNWSAVTSDNTLRALPLTVGSPPLTCGQGSSQGNFGTLKLANSAGGSEWEQVAMNIAVGLDHTLALYPSPADPWTCGTNDTSAVLWPREGTNCVSTKTGMAENAAMAGFIEGIGSTPGRLTNVAANTGCAASGLPSQRIVSGKTINNDTLSCFLNDSTATVGDVNASTYTASKPLLKASIYQSPRFGIVPVLGAQPGNGSSQNYQIVGFRAVFITDQVNSATAMTPATSTNGLTVNGDKLESVQVVFINPEALPPMEATRSTDYTGSGPKVLQLVD